jgi:hypothetical protein
MYLLTADEADLSSAASALKRDGNAKAQALFDALVQSHDIPENLRNQVMISDKVVDTRRKQLLETGWVLVGVHIKDRSFADDALDFSRQIVWGDVLLSFFGSFCGFRHGRELLSFAHLRVFFFQREKLWNVVVNDIRVVRMVFEVMLVVTFRRVEAVQRYHLGDDGPRKHVR